METNFKLNTQFQTPEWCCEYMATLIPKEVKTILEPTPGVGNIIRTLQNKYEITVPDNDFFNIDFTKKYDCIIGNPPWTPMKKAYEILYKCMEMSDNIIMLMPWLTMINSEKRTGDIMQFGLEKIIHLPRKTFAGARVQCCILKMKKGYIGKTEFINYIL